MNQHDLDEQRQRRADAAEAATKRHSVPWFMQDRLILGVFFVGVVVAILAGLFS